MLRCPLIYQFFLDHLDPPACAPHMNVVSIWCEIVKKKQEHLRLEVHESWQHSCRGSNAVPKVANLQDSIVQ